MPHSRPPSALPVSRLSLSAHRSYSRIAAPLPNLTYFHAHPPGRHAGRPAYHMQHSASTTRDQDPVVEEVPPFAAAAASSAEIFDGRRSTCGFVNDVAPSTRASRAAMSFECLLSGSRGAASGSALAPSFEPAHPIPAPHRPPTQMQLKWRGLVGRSRPEISCASVRKRSNQGGRLAENQTAKQNVGSSEFSEPSHVRQLL